MVFNQKPRKPIVFTEDHFHHPQSLKLASGTHTESILNRDKKHNEIYQNVTEKLLKRQNINNQINQRFTFVHL